MNGFVLDSSMAMAWFFEDEATPQTRAVFLRATREPVHVPALWHWETANVTWNGLRRGRFPQSQLKERLAILRALDVVTDQVSPSGVMEDVFPLANEHGLTVYDASYLELALRKGMPLATLDKDMIKAAKRIGVPLVGKDDAPAWEVREDAVAYGVRKKVKKKAKKRGSP